MQGLVPELPHVCLSVHLWKLKNAHEKLPVCKCLCMSVYWVRVHTLRVHVWVCPCRNFSKWDDSFSPSGAEVSCLLFSLVWGCIHLWPKHRGQTNWRWGCQVCAKTRTLLGFVPASIPPSHQTPSFGSRLNKRPWLESQMQNSWNSLMYNLNNANTGRWCCRAVPSCFIR